MSPSEFDAKVRSLIRACPWLSQTSGYRSEQRNRLLGGSTASKHLIGMAADFYCGTPRGIKQGEEQARELGFWVQVHGEPPHIHCQGLPPGEIPFWWQEKYGGIKNGNN